MYGHTIVVQFRVSKDTPMGIGTLAELDWRHEREKELHAILRADHHETFVDGGQAGGGSMEIFILTNDDVKEVVRTIMRYLTNHEYIGFCKVASIEHEDESDWTVHHPVMAIFSVWEWI